MDAPSPWQLRPSDTRCSVCQRASRAALPLQRCKLHTFWGDFDVKDLHIIRQQPVVLHEVARDVALAVHVHVYDLAAGVHARVSPRRAHDSALGQEELRGCCLKLALSQACARFTASEVLLIMWRAGQSLSHGHEQH
jgi:hypothetical protein